MDKNNQPDKSNTPHTNHTNEGNHPTPPTGPRQPSPDNPAGRDLVHEGQRELAERRDSPKQDSISGRDEQRGRNAEQSADKDGQKTGSGPSQDSAPKDRGQSK